MLIKFSYILWIILLLNFSFGNETMPSGAFSIARIHYSGGGDWYSDKSSIPNLLEFVSRHTSIITKKEQDVVKIGDNNFYSHSYFYITGHGNIDLSVKLGSMNFANLSAFLADSMVSFSKSSRKSIREHASRKLNACLV